MKPRANPAAELSPAVIALLLEGWGATALADVSPRDGVLSVMGGSGVAAARTGEDELFTVWMEYEAGVVRLWHRYTAFLLAEAKRLGVAPSYRLTNGQSVYFGAWCSVPWQDRVHDDHDHDDDDED